MANHRVCPGLQFCALVVTEVILYDVTDFPVLR